MSDRPRCVTGKIRFKSLKAAKLSMQIRRTRMRVYRCPKCKDLHITKEVKQDRRRNEEEE